MGNTLLWVHSGIRYLILLAGVVAAILSFIAWRRGGRDTRPSRASGAAFVGLLDLQLVAGVGVLLTHPFRPALMGHIPTMILAVAAAHVTSAMARKRAAKDEPAAGLRLAGVLLALGLIMIGIAAIGRRII